VGAIAAGVDEQESQTEKIGLASLEARHSAWLPFLAGEHACIGNRFAVLEMQTILSTLVARFDVQLVPEAPAIQPKLTITMRPKPALQLKITRRID
jgi:cytochrome P450